MKKQINKYQYKHLQKNSATSSALPLRVIPFSVLVIFLHLLVKSSTINLCCVFFFPSTLQHNYPPSSLNFVSSTLACACVKDFGAQLMTLKTAFTIFWQQRAVHNNSTLGSACMSPKSSDCIRFSACFFLFISVLNVNSV